MSADTPAEGEAASGETDAGDEPGPVRRVADTVTPPYISRPNTEMNALGWSLLIGLVVILLPFLPLILVVWGISKLLDALGGE